MGMGNAQKFALGVILPLPMAVEGIISIPTFCSDILSRM